MSRVAGIGLFTVVSGLYQTGGLLTGHALLLSTACRFHVPDDDFESARKAFEWPKRFAEALREAGTKAASEHRQFEAALKVRRKEFEQQIEQQVAKLAVVEGRNDIVKREVAAAEVGRSQDLGGTVCIRLH